MSCHVTKYVFDVTVDATIVLQVQGVQDEPQNGGAVCFTVVLALLQTSTSNILRLLVRVRVSVV